MKRVEEIKLNLDSLCVYRELFGEKVLNKFMLLVDKIFSESDLGECIKAYNDFTYDLYKRSKTLSLKECIVQEMLLNNNPFNICLEEGEEVPNAILEGFRNELRSLGQIALINSQITKELLVDKFDRNEACERRINSLINWGMSEEKYTKKNSTDFEIMKELLMSSNKWEKCTEQLIDFHKKNGTGRATAYSAFVWERYQGEEEGHLREISEPDPIKLSDLVGYELQKQDIIKNTRNFVRGVAANNLLLYGARGTGKSSTVKAILNEFYQDGLRLIEVDKDQLSDFTRIIRLLRHKKQRFIIFVDDLVFAENEASYSALKTILEGRIENRPSNILIYATTNRRHLVQEKFSDRDEVHSKDTQEEQLSLADRFGITISFFTPDQKEFLKIVEGLASARGLKVEQEYLHREALKWEKWHNGRSPRSARQFIDWLEGELTSNQ